MIRSYQSTNKPYQLTDFDGDTVTYTGFDTKEEYEKEKERRARIKKEIDDRYQHHKQQQGGKK